MEFKNEIMTLMHRFYRHDNYLISFIVAIQSLVDKILTVIVRLENLLHFNRLDENSCEWWEHLLNYSSTSNLEMRKSLIRIKWLRDSSNSLKLIKTICKSFDSNIEVTFSPETKAIRLVFSGMGTIPEYTDTLVSQIDEVKPAHIPLEYQTDTCLLIENIHEVLTIENMEKLNVNNYCKGKQE
jgi:hypothetical protein